MNNRYFILFIYLFIIFYCVPRNSDIVRMWAGHQASHADKSAKT